METLLNAFFRIGDAMLSDDVSSIFAFSIFAVFSFAIIFVNTKNEKRQRLIEIAPQTLTTLGILGTFTGIFLGLLDFDINRQNSVENLLEGLKVAFGSSILGLATGITLRILTPFISKRSISNEVGAAEIIDELKEIGKSLNGDGENSLASELQKLRAQTYDLSITNKEGFISLGTKFDEFSEKMSEAFSKAIIEELNNVIRDFNNKLTEQFGDNFKQLNLAVARLVDWQENYKNQMDALKTSLDSSLSAVEQSEKSLQHIVQSTEEIPNTLSSMPAIYERFKVEFNGLEGALAGFAEMRDKAQGAFPEIEKNILSVTENFRKSSEEQGRLQQEMLDGLQRSFNETVGNANNAMTDSIGKLDKAIQEEIQRVVSEMASNLSGITQQFVSDYQPLLDAHRRLIEIPNTGVASE